MKKILHLLFLVLFFLISATSAHAAENPGVKCTATTDPKPLTDAAKRMNLTIQTSGLVSGKDYYIVMGARGGDYLIRDHRNFPTIQGIHFKIDADKKIIINNLTAQAMVTTNPDWKEDQYQEKTYEFKIQDAQALGGQAYCKFSVTVQKAVAGGECTINFPGDLKFDSDTDTTFSVSGLPAGDGDHRMVFRRNGQDYNGGNVSKKRSELTSGVDLGKLDAGSYYLEIRDSYKPLTLGIGEGQACFSNFRIVAPGESGGGVFLQGGSKIPPPPPPCSTWVDLNGVPIPTASRNIQDPDFAKRCATLETAIGPMNTDLPSFIKSIFSIVLGLSGGIALVLIIISGYAMMTSQGEPEKIKNAKERLTSAIIGLLFILLSTAILQVIGVEILHVPGFK